MLRNADLAFLMYLRFPGDAGFTSIGDPSAVGEVDYTLGNGQVDHHPRAWCVEVEQGYKALAYFFVNDGEQRKWLRWQES